MARESDATTITAICLLAADTHCGALVRVDAARPQGTCGICDVFIDGIATPACTAKLARGKDITIDFKNVDEMADYAKQKLKDERAAKKEAGIAANGEPEWLRRQKAAGKKQAAEEERAKAAAGKVVPTGGFELPGFKPPEFKAPEFKAPEFNPFGKKEEPKPVAAAVEEDEVEEQEAPRATQQDLASRIMAENTAKKKGPWPF